MELLRLRPFAQEESPVEETINPHYIEEANNPNTSAERLEELLCHPALHRNIAKNPNVSLDVLMRVGYDFPREVLENPAFEMFLLEDAGKVFHHQHAYFAFQKIFGFPDVPQRFLYMSWHCGAMLDIVAQSPTLPHEIALSLATCDSNYVRAILAKNPVLSGFEDIAILLANDKNEVVLRHLADNENLPRSCFPQLLGCESFYLRSAIASKIEITEELFTMLSKDLYPVVVRALAKNQGLTAKQLETLSTHIDSEVRENVAANLNTSPEVLARLSTDKIRNIRLAVKNNPRTPKHIAESLADEPPITPWMGEYPQPTRIGDSGQLLSLPDLTSR